jgi:hypothetical protein
MPVRTTFYHPDRLVIGLFEGEMQLSDFVEFALEIQKNNLIHYRKILNVIDAHPGFTEQELRALVKMIREAPTDKPRGAVAFVANPERGEFAHLFASLEVDGRPARVFRSIHDARKWLTEIPPVRE